MNALMTLFAAALLVGCTGEADDDLRARLVVAETDLAATRTKLGTVEDEKRSADKRITELEAEIRSLKETDQARFQRAVDLEAEGKLEEASALFAEVTEKFPGSPLAEQARARSRSALKKAEALRAAAKKFVADLSKKLAAAPDASAAAQILDDAEVKYPFDDVQAAVAREREELKAALAKEGEASSNARELGIEISNVRTYWTVDPNVLGGRELVIPYIRFEVKNVSNHAITRLQAKAAFELTDKKELFGDGSVYAIGSSDPPLKPGYTKEVFFGSSVGYTGFGIYGGRPRMMADLYVQTSEGEERLVKTVRVSQRLNY